MISDKIFELRFCDTNEIGAYIKGGKKGGGGMNTHDEGGGMGGKGINNREDPGAREWPKKPTMGVVIHDIDVPRRCQLKNPNKVC